MMKSIVHLEGLVFFLSALFFYHSINGNWLVFLLLLSTPDISMIEYMKDKRIGATLYNLKHNYILAALI